MAWIRWAVRGTIAGQQPGHCAAYHVVTCCLYPMNRVDRLLGYLVIFQGRSIVRAQDLARRFEISERTVYRDIDALCEVGVPLVGMPGEGYQLLPGYYLPPIMFGESEARALFLAVAMLTGLTEAGATKQAAQAALEKIRAILPKSTLVQLEALQASLGFYKVSRPRFDPDDPKFLQLQQAIQQQRVVQFQYHALHDNRVTVRAVEPVHLAYLDDVWVLTGYCQLRQAQRIFRLDRIDWLTVTATTFVPRGPQAHERLHAGLPVRVRFAATVVRRVRENQHFTFTQAEPRQADGSTVMHYRVTTIGQIVGWLLSWGDGLEVLAPSELRQHLRHTALQIAERHRD